MDFRQSTQPNNSRPVVESTPPTSLEPKQPRIVPAKSKFESKWMRTLSGVVLIGVAVLLVGVGIALSRGTSGESGYVNTSQYQAVFLNNGQVYFGNIQNLTSGYLRLTNVYYLTQAGENNSNYTLVKLGCQQIHNPSDAMVINRAQVTFWENIENDGKVVKSIKDFNSKNPKGPDCSQVSTQTQASDTSTQNSQNSTGTGTTNNSTTGGTGTSSTPKSQ
jgi:hypothetical protein